MEKEKTYQTILYTIKRKTSKYNKYMKWCLECFTEDLELSSSEYTKTRKEAEKMVAGIKVLPVGNRLLITTYKEL